MIFTCVIYFYRKIFSELKMTLALKTLQLSGRSLTSVPSRTFINSEGVKKWAFSASGFNQYGLYRDDCLYETDDVKVIN